MMKDERPGDQMRCCKRGGSQHPSMLAGMAAANNWSTESLLRARS